MKKIVILALLLLIPLIWYLKKEDVGISGVSPNSNNSNSNSAQAEEKQIFVPYWTFENSLEVNNYDSIIYFGVTIDSEGIDTDEKGYVKLAQFSELLPEDKKKYLTLRIISQEVEKDILDDKNFQIKISKETQELVDTYGFDGVVVDYETSAFGFASTEERITEMFKTLSSSLRNGDSEFIVAVFGDTYYRGRPYNMEEINKISDGIIIMAYDFHKARLNPGPSFPLSDNDKYGYSLLRMVEDFKKDVDHQKIIIALGYFGYDWTLSDDGSTIGLAEPLSANQFNSRFADTCDFSKCSVNSNNDKEKYASYEDEEGFKHEVWVEDYTSIKVKTDALYDEGIKRLAFWAYSFY